MHTNAGTRCGRHGSISGVSPVGNETPIMSCISIQSWAFYLIGAALCAGAAIGFSLRVALDYAELTAYRRIARRDT